jgi:hypothetical protein
VGEHLVEVHRAHDRADIRHGQGDDRQLEIGDFVACFRRIEDLEEGDPVDGDGGIVLGDHLLLRNRDHLFHHVHPAADAVEEGNDDIQARCQGAGVTAEALDRPVIALRDHLDRAEQRHNGHDHDHDDQDIAAAETKQIHRNPPALYCRPKAAGVRARPQAD